MARIRTITKSRVEHRCGRCNDTIPVGASYKTAKPFRRRPMYRCMKPGCAFRQADLSSAHVAMLYDAIKVAEDAVGGADSVEDIKGALEECASVAREVGELYEEANSNWTSNGGADNEEWVEKREACEEFADELESWEPSEEVDEDEVTDKMVADNPINEDESEDAYAERINDAREVYMEEKLQEIRDEAIDKLGEFSA